MDRINELLINDKFSNLEQVAEILKEEITPIARNFLLISDTPIVRYSRCDDHYIFNIEIQASRVKPFGCKI